jgi:hypothetical protein
VGVHVSDAHYHYSIAKQNSTIQMMPLTLEILFEFMQCNIPKVLNLHFSVQFPPSLLDRIPIEKSWLDE